MKGVSLSLKEILRLFTRQHLACVHLHTSVGFPGVSASLFSLSFQFVSSSRQRIHFSIFFPRPLLFFSPTSASLCVGFITALFRPVFPRYFVPLHATVRPKKRVSLTCSSRVRRLVYRLVSFCPHTHLARSLALPAKRSDRTYS